MNTSLRMAWRAEGVRSPQWDDASKQSAVATLPANTALKSGAIAPGSSADNESSSATAEAGASHARRDGKVVGA